MPHFECGAFNHSATSPEILIHRIVLFFVEISIVSSGGTYYDRDTMNRVIDLKKNTTQPSKPTHVDDYRPVQSAPSPTPASLPPVKPSLTQPSSPLAWRFSAQSEPQTLWSVFAGLAILAVAVGFLGLYALSAILILAGTVLVLHARQSSIHEITLNEMGIRIDSRTYLFKDIKSFWLSYTPGGLQELSFHVAHWYLPRLIIPLSGKNPVPIRDFLISFIPEKEQQESFVSLLLYRVGL